MAATLQISFFGPFFYNLQANPIEIFAPQCVGHKAGIFSATNEAPLHGRLQRGDQRIYSLAGPIFLGTPPSPPPLFNGNIILDASTIGAPSPALTEAGFCLKVPVPRIVYGINPAPVEVVRAGNLPTGTLKNQATGLRFYYDADLTKDLTLSYDPASSVIQTFKFDAAALSVDLDDVYIRYAGTTPEDQDHEDAEECFSKIAELAGVDCFLCHEDSQHPGGLSTNFARAGNDCRAAIMIIT